MESIKQCLICNNSKFENFLECTDYFLSGENFTLVKCSECGFVFINPRPFPTELSKYYDSPDYISHSGTSKGLVGFIYKKIRRYTHSKKVKLVSKYTRGKSILDIGCGSGELLNLFKLNNWETLGIEPNQSARDFAKTNYNISILNENELSSIPSNSKDVITLWHVLEHVSGLNERMLELKRILKNDGVIFIAVPNRTSFDAEYYGKFWAAYDVPRHLYHFSQETMKRLLEKNNFSLVNILPMRFDSYYVSMLSEKYKSDKNNLLKAIYIGMKSNFMARKDKMDFSSLIYVIKNTKLT
jgi:2-polyprenyl-3-methyl-5-hydroxy-6-metoxy-1,4-benzoquinol methylase